MNKNLIRLAFAAALVVIVGYGIYANQKTDSMSELMLANVEALADDEDTSPCGGPKVNGECLSTNTINCKDLSGCQ